MRAVPLILLLLLVGACSAPPQKEIDLAQGAIDAARAAGAEQYAPQAFTAATSALQQAHEAVAQRDYRLALTRAMDAHDRAQDAAKGAADGKARARSEAEIAIVAAAAAVDRIQARVKAAEPSRTTRREIEQARAAAAAAHANVQKARAAVNEGNYAAANEAIKDLPGRVAAEIKRLDEALGKKPPRTARRSS